MRSCTTSRNLALLIGAAIVLAACTGVASGPQAWFDAPMHDSIHPVAPLEIVLHAADQGGVAMVEVMVNGEVLARRPPDDTTGPLVAFRSMWDPVRPGEYLLTARAQSQDGTWSATTSSRVRLTNTLDAPRLTTPTPTPRLLTPTWTSTPACVDRASFVADISIPDNSTLRPGVAFTKIWRLRNDGTCPWNEEYQIVFVDGAALENNTPLPVPGAVETGRTVDIAVDMVAPAAAGRYRGEYQIRNPQGLLFGVGADGLTPFHVQIIVGESPTLTPTVPPPPPDTQAPSVGISHSPSGASLPTGSSITFTANASDNVGVTRIDIWVTAPGQFPVLVKTCNNTTSCSYTGGPYNTMGTLSYFAIAADAAGHETNSGGHSITIYVVISELLGLSTW